MHAFRLAAAGEGPRQFARVERHGVSILQRHIGRRAAIDRDGHMRRSDQRQLHPVDALEARHAPLLFVFGAELMVGRQRCDPCPGCHRAAHRAVKRHRAARHRERAE